MRNGLAGRRKGAPYAAAREYAENMLPEIENGVNNGRIPKGFGFRAAPLDRSGETM